MIKKSLLLQKLASYSTLATIVLASEKNANAQILYTQINDSICRDGGYNLDLNNDGIPDFTIYPPYGDRFNISSPSLGGTLWADVSIKNENSNAIAASGNSSRRLAALYNSGEEIGTKDTFAEENLDLIYRRSFVSGEGSQEKIIPVAYFGLWDTTKHDKFLGLQLNVNNNIYYGWARLTVYTDYIFYCALLKDYAVNTHPGESILAGEEVSPPVNNGSLVLFPNPVSSKSNLNISFQLSASQPTTIIIYDIIGRKVRSVTLQNTYTDINTLQMNITGLAIGIYVLQISTSEFVSTKKFVITK